MLRLATPSPILSPFKSNPRPALVPLNHCIPRAACPAERYAHPAVRRHLEHAQQHKLHAAPRHIDERRGKWTRCLDQHERAAEHSPASNRAAPDHRPEERDV